MVTLSSTRQHTETVLYHFMPIIELYADTRLQNLPRMEVSADECVSALVVNSVISEIEFLLKKKLLATKGKRIYFEFTTAQAMVLYKGLLMLPIDKEYFLEVKNLWIELLGGCFNKVKPLQRRTVEIGFGLMFSEYE